MTTNSEAIDIAIDDEKVAGTILSPEARIPGVLFVHGWGGSQESDLIRAKRIAALGCLTFDLRGHGDTLAQQQTVSRADNLRDVIAAYDVLANNPDIDRSAIAVMGNSYGAYLASILSTQRPVKWQALSVPALYRDAEWDVPKRQLDREDLAECRSMHMGSSENKVLAACAQFEGDVLLLEAEHDHLVPHETIMSYRRAFVKAHSLTHRTYHAMSGETCQQAYTSILSAWAIEMIIGRRIGFMESSMLRTP